MRSSNDIVEDPAPKTVVIKGNAHLFTLLSVMWTAFSLIGVLFFRESHDSDPDGRWIAVGIWAMHLFFITLSIFFWMTETPKTVLKIDDEED